MPKRKALALLMLCSATALSACGEKRVVTNLAPPPERLVCEAAGPRPSIPPELIIDWAHVTSVAQAKIEHEGYVRAQRTREGVITTYLIEVEGKLFRCQNNMAWLRDWHKSLAQ